MNIYTTQFFSDCPANGLRIRYSLRIESEEPIKVETILAKIARLQRGFHEEIADSLKVLGGNQTLTADHHSVTIETIR